MKLEKPDAPTLMDIADAVDEASEFWNESDGEGAAWALIRGLEERGYYVGRTVN